jgi:hypothetical protein
MWQQQRHQQQQKKKKQEQQRQHSSSNLSHFVCSARAGMHVQVALSTLPDAFAQACHTFTRLQHLNLSGCSNLRQLPRSICSISSLQALTLCDCSALVELPDEDYLSKKITHLDLGGCSSLANLPSGIFNLKLLQELNLTGCSSLWQLPHPLKGQGYALPRLEKLLLEGCESLQQLPDAICCLPSLQELSLKGCVQIWRLPDEGYKLGKLHTLDLQDCSCLRMLPSGICRVKSLRVLLLDGCTALYKLPESFGNLTSLEVLSLQGCSNLAYLPDAFGELESLQTLRLDNCKLSQLPDSCRYLQSLRQFTYSGSQLDELVSGTQGMTPSQIITTMVETSQEQYRLHVVTKLARRQEPMLSTLERMSWLVVLLATATFIAYMQPPGAYDGGVVLVDNIATCASPLAVRSDPKTFRQCAMLMFFLLDGLSFGLSLGCVMMIVVLSMPRIPLVDDYAEAGRFYLLLALTWWLLYGAVLSGFLAFIASGMSVYDQKHVVAGPLIPGAIIFICGMVLLVGRFMTLFPGAPAIQAYLRVMYTVLRRKYQPQRVMDDDMC